jgi:hypothetical protein
MVKNDALIASILEWTPLKLKTNANSVNLSQTRKLSLSFQRAAHHQT